MTRSLHHTPKVPKRTFLGLTLALVLGLGLAGAEPARAASPAEPGPTVAEPALWVVRDADSTLYLFGTLHFLRPGTVWRDARIDAAFDAADELVLEIADANDTSAVMPLIQAHGLSPERPLSSLLTREELAQLDTAARSMGQSAAQMDPMRPWLATVMLSAAPTLRAGFAPDSGVDLALRAAALADGKTVSGFETPDVQIRMLSGFPEAGQLVGLRRALDAFDAAPSTRSTPRRWSWKPWSTPGGGATSTPSRPTPWFRCGQAASDCTKRCWSSGTRTGRIRSKPGSTGPARASSPSACCI